jgi:hypothetical protein
MDIGDLIIRPPELALVQQFRAEQVNEALFVQLPTNAERGLVCFLDKFGEKPTEDCRGYRIIKIPDGKQVAIVKQTTIPDIVWHRAFPLENVNLTSAEIAKAALEALPISLVIEHISTYTLERLLEAKGIHRADCKFALEIGLKISEAFAILDNAVNEAYDHTGDAMCLLLKSKLNGWRSEFLSKTKVGLEKAL